MIRKTVDVDWPGLGNVATPGDERVVQIEMLLGGKKEIDAGQSKSADVY